MSTNPAELKELLLSDVRRSLDIEVLGIQVNEEEVAKLEDESIRKLVTGKEQQRSFYFVAEDRGIYTGFQPNPNGLYGLESENGKPVLFRYGREKTRIGEVAFKKVTTHPLLESTTSDGTVFNTIASLREDGMVHVNYSQECVLKDKGEDCQFCNYSVRNATQKNPRQVGEVFSELFKAGAGQHLNLTSGFLHERRELDYYLDVGDEIQTRLGVKEFRATAVIGAPLDLSVIEKYKDAGYFSVRLNLEIWDKDIWKAVCPGKDKYCGGWQNWIDSAIEAVKIFGRARVGANIVGGIESKKSILEGIEFFLSRGIIASASTWRPVEGSILEGHRSPEPQWHYDLQTKIADLYERYNFTIEELHNVSPSAGTAVTIIQIRQEQFENGKLKPWHY